MHDKPFFPVGPVNMSNPIEAAKDGLVFCCSLLFMIPQFVDLLPAPETITKYTALAGAIISLITALWRLWKLVRKRNVVGKTDRERKGR